MALDVNILVVDDDRDICDYMKMLLGASGYNVTTLSDPTQATDVVKQGAFHVLIIDLMMPRMDGISLTKKLRENPKFKTTPILILTTESSDQMKQAGRTAGATGWLVKPFDPNRLIEVIQKVIR